MSTSLLFFLTDTNIFKMEEGEFKEQLAEWLNKSEYKISELCNRSGMGSIFVENEPIRFAFREKIIRSLFPHTIHFSFRKKVIL